VISPGPIFPTEHGPVQCASLDSEDIHHIGYTPDPWNFASWEYANQGRFTGRWDDPAGNWRAVYAGASAVACYLEVLAAFRPDPTLQTDMDVITSDDEDEQHPTIPPGHLPYDWCEPRLRCFGQLSVRFALPGHHETLPTLREQFLALARQADLTDLDAAAVLQSKSRELTQSISAWLYEMVGANGERINGIQYLSRHGDGFDLWAIYERGTDDSPSEVTARQQSLGITPEDEQLIEAMRVHRITWIQGPRSS
jgi:RES domain